MKDNTNANVPVTETETETKSEIKAKKKAEKRAARRARLKKKREGRRLRSISPMLKVTPYIMKTRNDAQNSFEDKINIDAIETYLAEKHEQGYTGMSIMHVLLAAYVRVVATRPGVNRFVRGQKIYARNNLTAIMAIKKEMKLESPDTMIKVRFEPTDTALEVYQKFDKVAKEALANTTEFDKTARIFDFIPGLLLRATVGVLQFLDYFGLLPRFLQNVSPFHGSLIFTNMGSIGINSIYHHLYNFGNLPVFLCLGKRMTEYQVQSDGSVKKMHFVSFTAVTDERICDGYYYASAFKLVKKYLLNPWVLDTPPKEVIEDVD